MKWLPDSLDFNPENIIEKKKKIQVMYLKKAVKWICQNIMDNDNTNVQLSKTKLEIELKSSEDHVKLGLWLEPSLHTPFFLLTVLHFCSRLYLDKSFRSWQVVCWFHQCFLFFFERYTYTFINHPHRYNYILYLNWNIGPSIEINNLCFVR